jgi:hypothetical protein
MNEHAGSDTFGNLQPISGLLRFVVNAYVKVKSQLTIHQIMPIMLIHHDVNEIEMVIENESVRLSVRDHVLIVIAGCQVVVTAGVGQIPGKHANFYYSSSMLAKRPLCIVNLSSSAHDFSGHQCSRQTHHSCSRSHRNK